MRTLLATGIFVLPFFIFRCQTSGEKKIDGNGKYGGLISEVSNGDSLSQPGKIILKGIYHGKNLYVQNPAGCDGKGFCVTECTVNGKLSTRLIHASAFEIPLHDWGGVDPGDSVTVILKYKSCCMPEVLNPQVISGR